MKMKDFNRELTLKLPIKHFRFKTSFYDITVNQLSKHQSNENILTVNQLSNSQSNEKKINRELPIKLPIKRPSVF